VRWASASKRLEASSRAATELLFSVRDKTRPHEQALNKFQIPSAEVECQGGYGGTGVDKSDDTARQNTPQTASAVGKGCSFTCFPIDLACHTGSGRGQPEMRASISSMTVLRLLKNHVEKDV
jgi:hypothetical protein